MSLQSCTVSDLMGQITQRRITDEGFLIAPGAIARAGNIQRYYADELGFDVTKGMDAKRIVRLYRPTSEVFAPETIKSFEGKTLTLGHPFGGVDAEKWKGVAIGDVHSVQIDGNHVGAELVVRDAEAIKAIQSGKRELSCGYTFDCDLTGGRTADGQEYDGSMRNIRGNHVAAVDSARGGSGCRVADREHPDFETQRSESHQERPMSATRKIVIAKDTRLELEDSQAELVQRVDSDYKEAVTKANDAAEAAIERAVTAEDALKAEKEASAKLVADHAKAIDELTKKVQTPEQIETLANDRAKAITEAQVEALAAERSKVVADALKLVPEYKDAGKTVAAIRTEALTAVVAGDDEGVKSVALAVLDGVAVDKAEPALIKAAVAAAAARVTKATDGRNADEITAQALLGNDGADARSTSRTMSGRDLMIFRQAHGGRSPAEVAGSQRS